MDHLSKEGRSKNMQAIRSKGSNIEIAFGKALWANGLRFRKNDKSVFGCPDFTFKKYKVAIFCDSEFWHGKEWEERKNDFKTNRKFWIAKIEKNINRDKIVNQKLKDDGWKVFRYWGKDIEKKLDICISEILNEIIKKKI